MKKTVYLLGLTLLCGFQAQAQEAPALADAVVAEPAADETAPLTEEQQTIFFSDELLDEQDSELKAPLLASDKIELQQILSTAPALQIPEGVKTPEAQTLPPTQEEKAEEAVAEQPAPETPQMMPEATPAQPQEPIAEAAPAADIPTAGEPQAVDEPVEPVVPAEVSVVEEVKEVEVIEEEKEAEKAPVEDIIPIQSSKVAPAPSIEKAQPTPKKNAFSLDENVLMQQAQSQTNSYSLDSNASLSDSFLKNDALSPSMLNRNIINISPEQRAKMMMKKKYDEMDTNQDGMVSESEFVEYKTNEARKIAHQVFKQIDRNDNKLLSQYEYGLLMDKMIENYIKPQK